MKQIALDIGLSSGPTLANFFAGPNQAALQHMQMWASNDKRSPVPTYVWGESGSGKTHLLRAVQAALRDQGCPVGWMDAAAPEPSAFDETWRVVILDDVHLYTAVQQPAAFNCLSTPPRLEMGSNAGCWLLVKYRPVTWRCVKICARAWAGGISFNCRCSVNRSVVRCCDSTPMNAVFF